MPYTYSFERLMSVFDDMAPTYARDIRRDRWVSHDGLLSVGLKLHILRNTEQFEPILSELQKPDSGNYFRHIDAGLCWVLPPVGSASTAEMLVEAIEVVAEAHIFGNSDVQIQVCSPGRLRRGYAALLAIGFYLGSSILRRFTRRDLTTTFSAEGHSVRGRRIVLYDALLCEFEGKFQWWGRDVNGQLRIRPELPFDKKRTDILTATSREDIRNINLIATLLMHAQYRGYLADVGKVFATNMARMLDEHMLSGVRSATWAHTKKPSVFDDEIFFGVLEDLVAYVFDEASRIQSMPTYMWSENSRSGILGEMQDLLESARSRVKEKTAKAFQHTIQEKYQWR